MNLTEGLCLFLLHQNKAKSWSSYPNISILLWGFRWVLFSELIYIALIDFYVMTSQFSYCCKGSFLFASFVIISLIPTVWVLLYEFSISICSFHVLCENLEEIIVVVVVIGGGGGWWHMNREEEKKMRGFEWYSNPRGVTHTIIKIFAKLFDMIWAGITLDKFIKPNSGDYKGNIVFASRNVHGATHSRPLKRQKKNKEKLKRMISDDISRELSTINESLQDELLLIIKPPLLFVLDII
ncbi:hypothetical protein IEQ34_017566 [Dendrobium chrysotoxum]|uniref:Transmembrane protein n=1 Tax=Dendrobium chrysotoxum TaxID=161865 RepID=A0AAV7GCG2_DENCH|nr:hypothetical protein IEQ34_017566 [Dendrobium chrysotoxum]